MFTVLAPVDCYSTKNVASAVIFQLFIQAAISLNSKSAVTFLVNTDVKTNNERLSKLVFKQHLTRQTKEVDTKSKVK